MQILSDKIQFSLEGKTHVYRGIKYLFTKGSLMIIPQIENAPKYVGNFSVIGSDTSNMELQISSSNYPELNGTLKLKCEFVNEDNIIPVVIS